MYVHRHAEEVIAKLSSMFGAILVAGPRQVGKTTMLRNFTDNSDEGEIRYVTLDDPVYLAEAQEESLTFLKDNPPPLFIDEVQRAPGLFPQIKVILDRDRKKGQFYLCGSQQFHMMKNVSESLAGRLGMLTLLGFSMRESAGCGIREPFIPEDAYYDIRKKDLPDVSYEEVWDMIHRGSMPELCVNPDFDWQMFYGAYVRTYIERDVRELTQIGDEVKFTRFMSVMASRTGQLLNLQSVANDVGISPPTANRWLSILIASNIVYLLQPFSDNQTHRTVKMPKMYFLDTGLAAYLTRWTTPDVLKNGAMAGAFFETFVIGEILKSYYNSGILDPPLYFYRDKDKKEIDLIIEKGDRIHPVEIKKHADPSARDIANFSVLDRFGDRRGPGGVICLYDHLVTLKGEDKVIPVKYL